MFNKNSKKKTKLVHVSTDEVYGDIKKNIQVDESYNYNPSSPYSASKAGIENFTRWMATEMALKYGDQVRVNAVAPGFFISKQNKALLTNEDGTFTERGQQVINKTPFKRFGKQKEIYGAIHYLLSDASSFVTGTVLAVDGGFSCFCGV